MLSNFFSNFILDEEQREETFDEILISVGNSDEHRLLTSDYDGEFESFYLFNRIKVWQKKVVDKNSNKNLLMFMLSFFLMLSIIIGSIYCYQTKIKNNDTSLSNNQKNNSYELPLKSKIKVIVKALIN